MSGPEAFKKSGNWVGDERSIFVAPATKIKFYDRSFFNLILYAK